MGKEISAWERVEIARNPKRKTSLDYINSIFDDFKYSILGARLSMIALLLLSSIIFIATELTIIDLFLIYGTIRTICAVPTLLVVFDKFNKSRLFYATCVTVIIAPVGYLISDKNVIFSIIALLLPLLGIALGKKSP